MSDIHDDINLSTAAKLIGAVGDQRPMATCPHDDEPLIATLEFNGAEFFCQVCKRKYGFLAPKPAKLTVELQARHDELREQYLAERVVREQSRG